MRGARSSTVPAPSVTCAWRRGRCALTVIIHEMIPEALAVFGAICRIRRWRAALLRSVRSRIMRVANGKVVEGKVVTDGAPFEDGASVTVIAADDAETFELGPEDEAALLAAIEEADRDEVVDGAELIAKLSSEDSTRRLAIRVAQRAAREIREASEWWRRNRPDA
jgi:hypothetical protein